VCCERYVDALVDGICDADEVDFAGCYNDPDGVTTRHGIVDGHASGIAHAARDD